MVRFSFTQRAVLVLFLTALLATPAIAGNEPRLRSESRAGFVARVLEYRAQVWSFLTGFWDKAGCGIDPHGACTMFPAPEQTKAGCHIDPHGACIEGSTSDAPSQTDAGCVIDPHGGCASGQ